MLLMPAFFGWVQYQHGLVTLVKCVAILVAFQVVIVLPFTVDPVANLFGFKLGGCTSWMNYLIKTKFIGGDSD